MNRLAKEESQYTKKRPIITRAMETTGRSCNSDLQQGGGEGCFGLSGHKGVVCMGDYLELNVD